MKKFISIVAALSMVASLSVTSFAAINVSVSEKDSGKATLVKESNGTFTADLATGSNTSQDTIVVVKGDGSLINTTSIQYINQVAAAQNFNFVLKDEPKFSGSEAQSATYTVLMGGDKVAKTEVGTITYAYTPDVTKYTIVFKAEDGTQISSTEYEEGATVSLPTDPTKAEDANYTYTFAGWKVEDADDNTATKSITATANATYVPVFTATPKGTETPEYMPGDVYVDGSVDDLDIMLLDYYYANMYDEIDSDFGPEHRFWENANDPRMLAADVFTDGSVDDIDIMLLDYYYANMYDEIDSDFGPEYRFWE